MSKDVYVPSIVMPDVHPEVAIATSGELLGNTDPRFGSAADVQLARFNLHTRMPLMAETFVIKPQAGDDLVDVDMSDSRIQNSGTFFEQPVIADALITRRRRVGLMLGTADCVPLMLAQPDRNILALIHLGWKGAALGLHDKTIDYAVAELGLEPASTVAYLGPSIQKKSYTTQKLSDEQQDNPDWYPHISEKDDAFHIDIPGFVTSALQFKGIPARNISESKVDTGRAADQHFSYTRHRQEEDVPNGRNGFLVALK